MAVSALACGSSDESGTREAGGPQPPGAVVKSPFVDGRVCGECHARELERWAGSHHDLAMQPATPDSVLGDFDDARFARFPVMTRFTRKDAEFWVNTQGPDSNTGDFRVAYTFGVEPLQQYLIELPGGRLQGLTIAWDTAGQRWIDLQPGEPIEPGDPYHWSGRYQRWNAMCAECHSTGLEKGYDLASDTYRTTWAGIDVGCQACHGPGTSHVEWARASQDHQASPSDGFGLPPNYRMEDATQQIEVCAPCHSRRHRINRDPAPGHPFLDHYVPRTLTQGLYHPDGQIRDEVYVYGSFVQSRMFQQGVRCSDCHDPHSLSLGAEGNALCTRCHGPDGNPDFSTLTKKIYDGAEHHFHPENSAGALCVECHMPARTYMQVDPRRDHSLRVPRPDLSVELGTPNACTGCHTERNDEWAAAQVVTWYGPERKTHWAHAVAAATAGDPAAGSDLVEIAGDTSLPSIVRATALDLLRAYGPSTLVAAFNALKDPDPLVRTLAVAGFDRLPPEARVSLVADHLNDASRAVRVEAARVMAEVPAEALSAEQQRDLEAALLEFTEAQLAQGDLPSAHLNLGVVQSARGQNDRAELSYRVALRMDPDFLPARANLVHLYDQMRRPADAERLLREGIARSPEEGEFYYSLGLLLAQENRLSDAVEALAGAAERMPDRARVHYNLGIARQQRGQMQEAEAALVRAREVDPGDAGIARTLAALYLQQGDLERARIHAKAALRLAPSDRMAQQLMQEIDAEEPPAPGGN